MQQLVVTISALDDGSVKGVVYTRAGESNTCAVVLPVPKRVDLDAHDVLDALTGPGHSSWLDSYAALCGIDPDEIRTIDELRRAIEWENEHGPRQRVFSIFTPGEVF